MNVLPTTRAGWSRLALLPFKVYVATAWLEVHCYLSAANRQFDPIDIEPVLLGYVLCIFILLLGGIVQWAHGRRHDSTLSFVAAAIGALIFWLLPSGLAKA
jgi:hypothetical protein